MALSRDDDNDENFTKFYGAVYCLKSR